MRSSSKRIEFALSELPQNVGRFESIYANAPERIHGRASSTWALTFLSFFLTRPTKRTNGVALGQEHRVTRRYWFGIANVNRKKLP